MSQTYSFHPIWFAGNSNSHIKIIPKMCCGFLGVLAIKSELVDALKQGDLKKKCHFKGELSNRS